LKSSIKKSLFQLTVVISILFGLGITTPTSPSGMDNAEPFGAFLDHRFPDVIPTGNLPYEPAFPNIEFDSPLTFNEIPSGGKIIIGQRDGQIYWFDKDPEVREKHLMLDLSSKVGVVWDGGFLGMALHPRFGDPGFNHFYVFYSTKDANGNDYPDFVGLQSCTESGDFGNYLILSRYTADPLTLEVAENSELIMLQLKMWGTGHRGGGMLFGDDGFLYLTTGDQSRFVNAQDIVNNLDGGVLRLDVDSDPAKSHPPVRTMPEDAGFPDEITGQGYWIPNDNPFLSPEGSNFEEYWSMGHRSPHRMTKDRLTGQLYIGEVGGGVHEEVNVVKKGKNYGWPVYEGTAFNTVGCMTELYNNMPHERPLAEFDRADANSLTGGYVYRGSEIPELYGKYICADYGIGEEIWTVDIVTGEYEQIGNFTSTDIISFGEDKEGELYILKLFTSTLYKMKATEEFSNDIPLFLSETGAFADLQTLEPSSGFIPYTLIESFWSDGAIKKRWLGIPNDGSPDSEEERIQYSEEGDWNFPAGTVIIKHFELPIDETDPSRTRRLETRFSIKTSAGKFYFLSYKWNEEGTDAALLETGLEEAYGIQEANGGVRIQSWEYPGPAECQTCHKSVTGGTLGLKSRYLNTDFTYPSGMTSNQLVTLSSLGFIATPITPMDAEDILTYKAIDDLEASLEERARSYLDLNCGYCHRAETGNRGNFDLSLNLTTEQTGLLNAGFNESLGIEDERIVYGGDAEKSILYHRMNSTDPAIRMPPLSKNVIDTPAVQLIAEWINQLEPPSEFKIANGVYYIQSRSSEKVGEIVDASLENSANFEQNELDYGENQQFIFTQNPTNGIYTITARHSGYALDVMYANDAAGTTVWQYMPNGTLAQQWFVEDAGDGYVHIISNLPNQLYLDLDGNNPANGTDIHIWPANGTTAQDWKLVPVDDLTTATSRESADEINIYPNPVGQELYVKLPSNNDQDLHYLIHSIHGEVIQTGVLNPGQAIQTGSLAKGYYLMTIRSGRDVYYRKVFLKM
jgi:uncharacterized repeat protein (TIGR03806 family)